MHISVDVLFGEGQKSSYQVSELSLALTVVLRTLNVLRRYVLTLNIPVARKGARNCLQCIIELTRRFVSTPTEPAVTCDRNSDARASDEARMRLGP